MFKLPNFSNKTTCLPMLGRILLRPNTHKAESVFENEYHKHHIQINMVQKILLSVGSGVMCLANPHRADMIACFGETSGELAGKLMLEKMENNEEGSEILRLKPRINSKTVELDKLMILPDGTVGKTYSNFLKKNGVTPDSRLTVQFVDDMNSAYVLQRYRETHDLFHSILGMPTTMLGEVTVKWVEAIQTKLPMCISAALFGPIRLMPKHRSLFKKYYLPWAITTANNSKYLLNIFFENRWEQPLSELHKEFNIKPLILPPVSH